MTTNTPPGSQHPYRVGRLQSALRETTSAVHADMQSHPVMQAFMRGRLTREGYGRLIEAYHRLFSALDAAIARHADARATPFPWAYTPRVPWLTEDLRALGHPLPGEGSPGAPEIGTDGAWLGAVYTIQGSTLGGRKLAVLLAEHLGITPASGGRFFSGFGDENEARWRQFCAFADTVAGDDVPAEAGASAVATFAAFRSAIDSVQP